MGMQVEQRDGQVFVVAPIAGTPLNGAGMRRGDKLLKIDGKVLENPTVDKTVKLNARRCRTPEGDFNTVYRPSQNRSIDFKLKRERIRLESVVNRLT